MSEGIDWARFRVSLDELGFVGLGLNRPECVLSTASGDLYTSDWRGVVARTSRGGATTLFAGRHPTPALALRPNGIALRRSGSFLIAQLVWKRTPSPCPLPHWGRGLRRLGKAKPSLAGTG